MTAVACARSCSSMRNYCEYDGEKQKYINEEALKWKLRPCHGPTKMMVWTMMMMTTKHKTQELQKTDII